MQRTPRLLALLLALAGAMVRPALAQQAGRTDQIRGRVVNNQGAPVSGADVIATRAPDRATQATRTDTAGRYSIAFPNGTGDYLVQVSAAGFQLFRQRVTRSATGTAGGDSALVVDAKLTAAAAVTLATVQVQARRERPTRGPGFGTETGSSERVADGVPAALSPTEQGDLAAIAAVVPGMVPVDGGVSAFGLAPGANSATLNGLAFGGADIPRDARTRTRVSGSTYDPARGGFAGAQVAVELQPGFQFSFRQGHVTLDAPALQYADPTSARLGGEFSNLQLSAGGSGELIYQRYFYNYGVQASRRAQEALFLTGADAGVLRAAGVAADSAGRLLRLLSAAGIPADLEVVPDSRLNESVSLIGRIDRTPSGPHAFGLTGYAKVDRAGAGFGGPTLTAASGGRTDSFVGSVQGSYSFYFNKSYLSETKSAFSLSDNHGEPYLQLPGGRVAVSSRFADGSGGLASLGFGGNGALARQGRNWTWETTNETQWFNWTNEHKIKLWAQSRLDGYDREATGDRLGTFSYASLADLEANRPASFARTLDAPEVSGTKWSGVLALGDQWRRSATLHFLYGARLEADHYLDLPAANPAVEKAFGVRTDQAPGGVHVSPRFGFTWAYRGQPLNRGGSFTVSPLGTRYSVPRGVIRGGVGEFRGELAPSLLEPAQFATGVPGTGRRIFCVGPAVPIPDWARYAGDQSSIPDRCADGSTGSAFADVTPRVELFDPGYDAPRSWRGNLAWSSQYRKLALTVEGTYSLHLDQPSTLDLNFAGEPRFTLAAEGGRPVYVSPGSIVPATGATAAAEARRVPTFGRVMSRRSDLQAENRQLTLTATPDLNFGRFFTSLAYTLSDTRSEFRGFDGGAFGDPAAVERARGGYDPRHQFQLSAGYSRPGVSVTAFGRLFSGRPFTPIVSGDVNGDGLWGDRAFVFDPQTVADPTLAGGLRELLAHSPEWARDCLSEQRGEAAARNSCRGPWTQTLNARLVVGNQFARGGGKLRNRATVAVNLANPLGGLDRLLHGGEGLRGWGASATPDPVLLRVRGFDPARREFRYEANPRFGDTRSASALNRAPFRITLDVTLALGVPVERQQLERFVRPGGGSRPRLAADSVAKLYARNVPDPYNQLIQLRDSLLLTNEQVTELRKAQAGYRTRIDSLWKDLATYVTSLPASYNATEAVKRQEAAVDQGWLLTRQEGPTVQAILSPLQWGLVGSGMRSNLDPNNKSRIRMFFSG